MLGLENLGRNPEADVTGLLDAAVHINVAVVDDKDQKPGHGVVAVSSLIPGFGDFRMLAEYMNVRPKVQLTKFATVSKAARAHPRLLAMLRVGCEDTAVALVYLSKFRNESLHDWLRRRSRTLDHTDPPGFDRTILIVHSELATAATKISWLNLENIGEEHTQGAIDRQSCLGA